jgi:hypothetical protein
MMPKTKVEAGMVAIVRSDESERPTSAAVAKTTAAFAPARPVAMARISAL